MPGQAQHTAGLSKGNSDGWKSDRLLGSIQAKICKALVVEGRVSLCSGLFTLQLIAIREMRALCLPNFA